MYRIPFLLLFITLSLPYSLSTIPANAATTTRSTERATMNMLPQKENGDSFILNNEAIVDFPNSVTFNLTVDPNASISHAILTYDVLKFSCVEVSSQIELPLDGNELSWEWQMVRSSNPPPGSTIWWEWTLIDADGTQFQSTRQELTLTDARFDWETISEDGIHLHWYRGSDTGPKLLTAALSGRQRLESEMGIELQEDVDLYIYGNASEMRDALLYVQDWAGGVAFSDYNTILIGVTPSSLDDWGVKTVRHELAHLIIGQFGRNCVGGSRPNWLDEGLAMYAEGEADENTLADIRKGVEEDAFTPIRSLNGTFPAHGNDAGLAYSQSYSIVSFLINQYGQEKLEQLLHTLAAGTSYDQALEQVYDVNTDGLETIWRESINAPPRTILPTPTPLQINAIPTYPLADSSANYPTPNPIPTTSPYQPISESNSGLCTAPLFSLFFVAIFFSRPTKKKGNHV